MFSDRGGHLSRQFLGEQRVSLSGCHDVLGNVGTSVGEECRDERARLLLGQRVETDLRHARARGPPDLLLVELGPGCDDQQQRPCGSSKHQLHHLVRILDHDDHGTSRGQTSQERRP